MPRDSSGRKPPSKSSRRSSRIALSARRGKKGPVLTTEGAPEAAVVEVARVPLSHPDRVLYPSQGITKRALALFYERIAAHILPHLAGRPLTLVRCPAGVDEPCFFMKHSSAPPSPNIRTLSIREKAKSGMYLFIDSLAGLIELVQMGVLEIHTWNARANRLEFPDRLVFDLDPDPSVGWDKVVDTAYAIRARLQLIDLQSFVKTTGGKGLHVVTPIAPVSSWADCLVFSRGLAESFVRSDPSAYTSVVSKAERRGKILIDYLRNARGSTSVAAYSTRARKGAPVSTPLAWAELSSSHEFSLETLPARLASLKQDPWAGYTNLKQRLTPSILKKLIEVATKP
jgi:bifunctional non-homologous end joining protein LigD